MKIELSKPISKLLRELPTDWEPNSWIITVDNITNEITGNNEILDGNHRMAVLIDEDRIIKAVVYAIDYNEANKMGFFDNSENQEIFEKWVIENGTKIENYEIETI